MTGRFALLLGTSVHHTEPGLTGLPAVRHDVRQLAAALDQTGAYDAVDTRIDLTRDQLTGAVEEFYGSRRRGDLALLYFSGHGLLHADRESLFLAATDTELDRLLTTGLDTAAVLKDLLSRTYATQKVIILDCCFSGAFGAGGRFRGGAREEPRGGLRHAGTFVLTSSTHMRASFATGSDGPSVFTGVLLDGLRGAAEPRAGSFWITTHDLSHFVQVEMQRRGGRAPSESSEGVVEPIPLVAVEQQVGARSGGQGRTVVTGPFDEDRWRRLLGYYSAALERSAVLQSFTDVSDHYGYVPLPAGAEPVFAWPGEAPRLPDRLGSWVRQTQQPGDLRYGYPVAVRQAPAGKRQAQLAPLLECDASIGADGVLRTTLPPRVNAALARDLGLADKEIDELTAKVEETFVAGDAAAVIATVRLVVEVFGLHLVTPIDPAELTGTVRTGPLRSVQNTAVLLRGGSTGDALLLQDLRDIASKPGAIADTALGVLADPATTTASDGQDVLVVAPDPLNEVQERVVRAAMTDRLTVAQGPPGTGKSQLVTALVATAAAAGQSVLVSSTNNRAVDEVTDRCAERMGPGLLVRTGNKEQRGKEPALLTDLLSRYATTPRPDTATPAADLRILQQEIGELRQSLDSRRLLERDLAELAVERQVPSGPPLALPGDDRSLMRLVRRAEQAQRRGLPGWWSRLRLRAQGVEGHRELALRGTIELRWRAARTAVAGLPDRPAEWPRLTQCLGQERPAASRALLAAQIAGRVRNGQEILRRRIEDLSTPSPRSWSRFTDLLQPLPAWAVTALSARRLPPRPALFDLVVIDEAATCTIPAVLPLLHRARRVLLIGDPRQLGPVVTLPTAEDVLRQRTAGLDEEWLDAARLTFARHSAYDAFAAAAGAAHLLDEHYRCHPDIVAAPNREVYQGRLVVLTDPGRLTVRVEPAVLWRDVSGRYVRGAGGSGRNPEEAAAVVAEVARIRAEFPTATVGVVTPLAAQAALLGRELRGTEVVCGTVHRFQGGERDVMVVSPVGADGVSDSTRSWLVGQANLWNVAITRAKANLVIVGDRSWWAGQRGMLAALALGAEASDPTAIAPTPAADALHRAALAAGLPVRRCERRSGHPYDMVLSGSTGDVAVMVDDPAGRADGRSLRVLLAQLDLAGHRTPIRRAPAWRCLVEPETLLAELTGHRLPSA